MALISKEEANFSELKEKVKNLCEERDWDQFHGAKDLAIGIITEASEVLEHFRFKSEKEVEDLFKNSEKREHIENELADVFWFLLRFSQKYEINLNEAFQRKILEFEKKYPIEKSKGSNKKYNEI
jgi:NTP pyrophosphatase (non-canonical NTP hydrolase)